MSQPSPPSAPQRCAVESCPEDARTRGWCGTHHQRWLRTGSTDQPAGRARYEEANWSARLDLLVAFVEQHHRFPTQREIVNGVALGQWVGTQRGAQRRGTLSAERVARLEAIPGWSWGAGSRSPRTGPVVTPVRGAVEAASPVPSNPDILVSGGGAEEVVASAGLRGASARLAKVEGREVQVLSPRPADSTVPAVTVRLSWHEAYKVVRDYYAQHGPPTADTVIRLPGGLFPVGRWCARQRATYTNGTMAWDRFELLDAIPGWEWARPKVSWETAMRVVEAWVSVHGTYPPTWLEVVLPDPQHGRQTETVVDGVPRALASEDPGGSHGGALVFRHDDPRRTTWGRVQRGVPFAISGEPVPDGVAPVVFRPWDWLRQQRYWRGRSRHTAERRARLEQVPGFTWPSGAYTGSGGIALR